MCASTVAVGFQWTSTPIVQRVNTRTPTMAMAALTIMALISGSFTDDYLRPYASMDNTSILFNRTSASNADLEDEMAGKTFVHLFEWKWSDVAVS